jgi:hypothetical protein
MRIEASQSVGKFSISFTLCEAFELAEPEASEIGSGIDEERKKLIL